tara:strand:- start:51 stop:341 length:291 start_codon:yes stop_codon:yes gene_type:complete
MKYRSQAYLKHIRSYPCLVCGGFGEHAHHLRHAERRGWGTKNSDEFAVSLCAEHHMECHTKGDESLWWAMKGIDALDWAKNTYVEYKKERLWNTKE